MNMQGLKQDMPISQTAGASNRRHIVSPLLDANEFLPKLMSVSGDNVGIYLHRGRTSFILLATGYLCRSLMYPTAKG